MKYAFRPLPPLPWRFAIKVAVLVVFVAICGLPAFADDILYLTSGDSQMIYAVDTTNGTIVNQWTAHDTEEYPIAASGGTIRTTGRDSGEPGSQYTLSGSFTGTAYANPVPAGGFSFDATSDGTHNYMIDDNTGEVYQTNLDYTSPTGLFNLGHTNFWVGISYDAANNSLWVSQLTGETVADYTLGGALISSFSTGHSRNVALAYDPADSTLWLDKNGALGSINLEQWSTTGMLLGTLNFTTGLPGDTNILGGEFEEPGGPSPVPEPSSIALLATVGGALLLALRRKGAAT